jgi:hypothetical protein
VGKNLVGKVGVETPYEGNRGNGARLSAVKTLIFVNGRK